MSKFTEVFENIYQNKTWVSKHKNPTSLSGPGSFVGRTKEYHVFLNEFIKKHKIQSVVDYGCGDCGVYDGFDLNNLNYFGIDVSRTAIELAQKKYPTKQFLCTETLDIPVGDLLIVKDVFGHWSGEKSTDGLGNQLHLIADFLNFNYDKFKFILIVDGGSLMEHFPAYCEFKLQKLMLGKKTKTLHIKET
jgi:SAM-dependent methyltransferase